MFIEVMAASGDWQAATFKVGNYGGKFAADKITIEIVR
jgi:hypothetical protein